MLMPRENVAKERYVLPLGWPKVKSIKRSSPLESNMKTRQDQDS